MEMHVNKFDGLIKTDILIVSATQIKQTIIQGVLKEIDKTLNGLITQVMKKNPTLQSQSITLGENGRKITV